MNTILQLENNGDGVKKMEEWNKIFLINAFFSIVISIIFIFISNEYNPEIYTIIWLLVMILFYATRFEIGIKI